MSDINTKFQLGGFRTDDGEFITFIDKIQVDYCLLLRKKTDAFGDFVSNYEIVKKVFSVSYCNRSKGRDILTKKKYPVCQIVSSGNDKVVYCKNVVKEGELILVTYREYYYRDFLNNLSKENNNMLQIHDLWNTKLLDDMYKTLSSEKDAIKARTRG